MWRTLDSQKYYDRECVSILLQFWSLWSFGCSSWLWSKLPKPIHTLWVVLHLVHFMRIPSTNVSSWLAFNIFLVDGMQNMRCSCGVTCFLFMIIRWENLSESILHFHFSIEGSGLMPFWREISSRAWEAGHGRLIVKVPIIKGMCLPIFLNLLSFSVLCP